MFYFAILIFSLIIAYRRYSGCCKGGIIIANNKKWLRAKGDVHDDRRDIMILKLNGKISLSNKAKIARLLKEPSAPGTAINSAGWGLTNKTNEPDVLQKLTTVIQPLKRCKDAVDEEFDFFPPYEICTFAAKGKGLCSGDSGSPLMKDDGVLVGVALWVANQCASGLPDYIANVFYYSDFIKTHLTSTDNIYKTDNSSEEVEMSVFSQE